MKFRKKQENKQETRKEEDENVGETGATGVGNDPEASLVVWKDRRRSMNNVEKQIE